MTVLHAERVGSGPRLVLVHGFTQTGRSWGPVAADLSQDHEVVSVDAPGHGGSSDVTADLLAGAELLGRAGGPAIYIGYSMGGRLALHLALARPDLVHGLVLIGATAGIEDQPERAARRAADEQLATELERDGVAQFLERWLAQPLFASLPPEAAGLDDRLRNTAAGLASSLRLAGTGTQQPLWDQLAELSMPVLVVAGDRDDKFSAIGSRIAEAIGPNTTFALVPSAGHTCHLEQPDEFLPVLREWLLGVRRQRRG